MIELSEIFLRLVGKGGPYQENQKGLAVFLGIDQTTISRIKNGGMPEWKEHFRVFLKLIPLAVDAGILGARDLLPPDGHGPEGTASDLERSKTTPAKTGQRRKTANG